MKKVAGKAFLAAGLTLLAGCDTGEDRTPEKRWGEPGYGEDKVVQMQLCLPACRIAFDTMPVDMSYLDATHRGDKHSLLVWTYTELLFAERTVRIARLSTAVDGVAMMDADVDVRSRHGDVVGNGGAMMRLAGSTKLGQPVFEGHGYHPEHYIAIHSRTMPVAGQVGHGPEFWFQLPGKVDTSWTAWLPPLTEVVTENEQARYFAEWKMLEGGTLKPMPIRSSGFPRMRFRLVTNDQLAAVELVWRPAYFATYSQLQPKHRPGDPLPVTLPPEHEPIPGC